ncbi:MAG TPA: aldose epimerase family protein [Terracidiphilus sp.]|nr:aldose epimerase family protein [Terracidiphilus sp.]
MKRVIGFAAAIFAVAMALTAVAQGEVKMSIWGHTADGTPVPIYTLRSGQIEVRVMAYGAKLVSVKTPDRSGKMADVVLGYDSLENYLNDSQTHFGSIVGRYGNRIALGKFTLDGKTYQIPINNGPNALHGGTMGFDRHVWQSKEVPNGAEFTLVSPDGDMGFPGTLTAHVKYTVQGNTLRIDYSATTDKDTVLNITNHAYFNLNGDDKGTILNQKIQIDAERYTPTDAGLIPTGELAPVAGTPLDFRKPEVIGARINDDNAQLKLAGGYDFNFVLDGKMGTMHPAATVADPESGRKMTVETTEPGVQFYSGNFLDGTFTGRHGVKYVRNTGFCLETQHFPDSPNHPNFPSTVVHPGQTFHSTTTFTFSVEK